jgi:hypothetical protein
VRVRFTCSIGFNNANQEEIVELDDDLTDDEIEEEYGQWRANFLDGCWTRL